MSIAIAIDGPAGAGKSTISKAAAKRLGFIYIDTGALYRNVGLAASRAGVEPKEGKEVEKLLSEISVELTFNDKGEQVVLLNKEDVSGLIRTPEASMMASAISAVPSVRAFLLDLQRDIAKTNNVIMDGRDIGTVILPDAEVKIFLTAAPEARAERRYKELKEKGMDINYDDILQDVITRDYNDSHREIAPLRQADDAVLADTTEVDLDGSIELIISIIKEKTNGAV
ncbi:MAG: (d)CMP kinase [Ruminococcus sp.]|nr:(d)CMP kinase [Ruminococcus sp.]